jgi:hypothetical protein
LYIDLLGPTWIAIVDCYILIFQTIWQYSNNMLKANMVRTKHYGTKNM